MWLRSFDELTSGSQRRRLRAFATEVLRAYAIPLEGLRLRIAARSFNTVFRVSLPTGFDGALRIGPRERIHAEGTEDVEAAWMRSLHDDGVVIPPRVLDSADGHPAVHHEGAGLPGRRVCMLFEWCAGHPLRDSMSLDGAQELGRMAALLHEHGAATRPAEIPRVLVADKALYWRLPNHLSKTPEGSMLTEALERVTQVIETLWAEWPNPPHLVHGDLTGANVLAHEGTLRPIDFQDLVWALDIQDLSISLSSLDRFAGATELKEAFSRGYGTVSPWPSAGPEILVALIAARRLHMLNLTLELGRPGAGATVERLTRSIAAWMRVQDSQIRRHVATTDGK